MENIGLSLFYVKLFINNEIDVNVKCIRQEHLLATNMACNGI